VPVDMALLMHTYKIGVIQAFDSCDSYGSIIITFGSNTANINVHRTQEIYKTIHTFKDYIYLSAVTLNNSFTKNTVEFLQEPVGLDTSEIFKYSVLSSGTDTDLSS